MIGCLSASRAIQTAESHATVQTQEAEEAQEGSERHSVNVPRSAVT